MKQIQHYQNFDVVQRARQAMVEAGFEPEFNTQAQLQAETLHEKPLPEGIRDLRHLLWSSIDNEDSKDLDQVEYAERLDNGDIRIFVGIADVDALVDEYTPIDKHASTNTTTVYTGVKNFPMLPERLSTGLTSLNENEDRRAVVTEMDIDEDGDISRSEIYLASIKNKAQLVYESVGDWLEKQAEMPEKVSALEGLAEQLQMQHEAAARLVAFRKRSGMLDFETIEIQPVVKDGKVVGLYAPKKNLARVLIGNLMIAANTVMATFLEEKGVSAIQRVVKTPKNWPRIADIAREKGVELPRDPDSKALSEFLNGQKERDPDHYQDLSISIVKLIGSGEYDLVRGVKKLAMGGNTQSDAIGHFGLAVQRYTHSTAPNRRFVDLVIQRQVKTLLTTDQPPYSESQLARIADHCTEREDAAQKVERLMRKVAAAALVADKIGDVFKGIVTGASHKGTYVRISEPPIEGRVVQRFHGMNVGQHVKVRLIGIDPGRGFIDFEGA